MSELSDVERTVLQRMTAGRWYHAAELVAEGESIALLVARLGRLTARGLVERELAAGHRQRYQYRLVPTLRRKASSNVASTVPLTSDRLAEWKQWLRQLARRIGDWLKEFIP